MTALGTLYEEVNSKSASYVVRVGGVSYTVEGFSYNFAMGEVPSANFEIRNPLPAAIVYSAPVEIYAGYNGLLQLVFTGQIETPTPGTTTTTVECSGISRLLRVPYKRLVRVINGQDASVIVAGMLDDAGVTNYAVNLEPWVVGAIVTTVLEFQTWDNAINKVATVDGSPWYELPTGQIRVELRDPWPAPTFFRQYYSGDLRSLTDAERAQWLAGTLPLSAIQPANIVNANAQPRVRDGVRQTTLLSNVRNQVYIEGAVLDVTGPDGEITSARIEARAQSTLVPWITGGRLQDWTFDNELIDTQAKADTVAARKFQMVSRLDQRVALTVDGDPEIVLGKTVNVEDPAYTGITGNWFVYGYSGRMDSSGYSLQLDLRGGVNAGVTPLLSPVADFVFGNEYTAFAKIKQVTPLTTGAVLVTFDGRSSFDPDGTIAAWAWADDQGNTGSGSVISFAYNQALSEIQMTLTVTDNDGLTDSITKRVNIATSSDACGDAGTCAIFAAIKTHMTVSQDGGASWTDVSKAAAAAVGDFISVGTSGRSQFLAGVPLTSQETTTIAIYGTSAGEFYRTDDFLGSTTKYTIPSGRPIVSIWCMNPVGNVIWEWWFIADDAGNVYAFTFWSENSDYGLALYHSDGKLTVNAQLIMQGQITSDASNVFTPLTEGVLIGGDSSDPDTMIRRVQGSIQNQSSVGGTFTFGLGTPVRPNPIPPIDGALRAAILAAGPGHSAQAMAGFLVFSSNAFGGTQPFIDSVKRFGIMFTSGVDPRVWFHDGTAWQPATGLTPATDGQFLVGGFAQNFLLAVLAQLKTFSATDGTTFVEGTTGSPSQIRHVIWELGLLGIYLGAADNGIVKSLDGGDSWGYIRPHAGVGTTWPVGADGKQVAIAFTVADPCPNIYSLARTPGGGGFDIDVLTQGGDTVDQATTASYTTASYTPDPNRTQYALIAVKKQSGTTPPPTLTGNGLTWTLELEGVLTTSPAHNSHNNLYLYKAQGVATAGALNIAFGAGDTNSNWQNCVWIVFDVQGCAITAVQAVRQDDGVVTNTSMTIPLSAFASASNPTLGCIAVMFNANTAITPGSGFTELAEQLSDDPSGGNDLRIQVQYKASSDTSVDWTFANFLNARVMGFALELNLTGPVDNLLNLAGSSWQLVENTRSADSFGLQYLGGSGRMIHLVDDDLPQISFDYGVSWQASNTPPPGYPICTAVAMDAQGERLWGLWRTGNTITADDTAIAYSTDWGDTWIVVEEDLAANHYYLDIACHPTDVNRIVVTGAQSSTGYTWKTTDRGVNWTQSAGPALQNALVYRAHDVPGAGVKSQCVTFSPYGRLIWSTGGRTADGDVYYSDDYGATWTKSDYDVTPPLAEGMVHLLRCGPFGPYYTLHFGRNASSTPIFRSDDHGVHWVAVAPPDVSDDYNGIGYDPLSNTVLFHRDDTSEVWGLDPASGDWADLTSNYNSVGGSVPGVVVQPLTFVGDPPSAGS